MVSRSHIMQVVWIVAAAGLLVAGGLLHRQLDAQSSQYELNPPEVAQTHPAKALLTMAPGGLRAPLVGYLWMRAEDLKLNGRHYEAMQLADLICKLQPNFPGVWVFHAWNMAWNISVTTHTPEERWLWVYNGVKLLRDEGIPQNRKSILLYQQLGWTFFFKMGQTMDEMHLAYKQRWAWQMQRLLTSPPYGTTAETIAAFRPIAEAPIDKARRLQGKQTIQPDRLAVVLSDPAAAAYAELLKAQGVEVGQELLDVYNHYSLDEAVRFARMEPPKLQTDRDKALSALINSDQHAEARKKLLAFVRAQVLWNVYKMDPDWMLKLMEKYGPLDWRLVQPHGLYWATYGIHVCQMKNLDDINSLNTDRLVLNCMKVLTWRGRLSYLESIDPERPHSPRLGFATDWRFVEPGHKEFVLMGQAEAEFNKKEFKNNFLRSGHINYLIQAIQMFYAAYRHEKARELIGWVKENYQPTDPQWEMDLEDFVIHTLNREGKPIPDRAYSQITAALQAAFIQLAQGNAQAHKASMSYALKVYNLFQRHALPRNKLPPFRILMRGILIDLLINPPIVGLSIPLLTRVDLYSRLDVAMQRSFYRRIAPVLWQECQLERIDFAKAFPAPPGVEEYRAPQR